MAVCGNPKCGIEFAPKRAWQRYCCAGCRAQAHNMRQIAKTSTLDHAFRVMLKSFEGLPRDRMIQIINEVKDKAA